MKTFIPAPPLNVFHLGFLTIHLYSLTLLLATLLFISLTLKLTPYKKEFESIVPGILICSILGARIYHILTSLKLYLPSHPLDMLKIYEGGLSIWGALLASLLYLVYQSHKLKINLYSLLNPLLPALALAQGIGRFGNYFNQELFGSPTSLPWKLMVEPNYRPKATPNLQYYHPTFLYEAIGVIALSGILYYLYLKTRLPKLIPSLIPLLYLLGYSLIRILTETLRTDYSPTFLGLRFNLLLAISLALLSLTLLLIRIKKSLLLANKP